MYGVKGTSAIIHSVTRQGVLTKQLVAPKSTAFLTNLPTRSAGKLSYTTRSQPQKQEQVDTNNAAATTTSAATLARFSQQQHPWTTVTGPKKSNARLSRSIEAVSIDPAHVDGHILQAAKQKNSEAVVNAFVQGRSAAGEKPPHLSTQTYEAVIEAYSRLRKHNQPLTPMMNAYQDMIASGAKPTSQTYALLIRTLCSRHGEVQKTVNMLRRQMARSGGHVSNLVELENEHNIEKALDLFNKAVSEKCTQDFDTELYNTLIRSLSFKGNKQDGIYIYEHLESSHNASPNSNTFATLVFLFGNAGDLKAAKECFNEYKLLKHRLPAHDPSNVYNAFVHAHCNVGDLKSALEVIEKDMVQDRIRITIVPYNKVLRRACLEGKMETVDSVLARLEKDQKLPRPDADTYGIVLSAYARLKNFDKATEAYKNLLNYDISKQYGYLADYVYACIASNRPDEAFEAVKSMTSRGLDLNANMCTRIVSAYVDNNRIQDAADVFKPLIEIHSKSNFLDAYSPVSRLALDLATKCNDLKTSVSILGLLSHYNVHPTAASSAMVVDLYHKAKQSDQWDQITKNLPERFYPVMYDAIFRKDNTNEEFCNLAFELLHDMRSLSLTLPVSLYVRVLARMKKYASKELEMRWKKEFSLQGQEEISSVKGVKEEDLSAETFMTTQSDILSAEALNAVLNDQLDSAIDILTNKIIKPGQVPTPEAVRDMIQHFTKQNRLHAAQEVYNVVADSFNVLDTHRQQKAHYIVYNSMLIAHARNGNLQAAKVFYDKLRQNELYPDADAYASLLACTANSTTDESTDALAIYEEAKKHHVRPTVYFYNVIISKLAKCRKLDPALHLFDEMKQLGVAPNSITYASVISACIRCSSESRAARYFQEMISLPKYQPRIGAYNSMIQFYVQQKPDREKALEYYNLSKRHNLKPSEHTYKLLMEAYANIPAYDMLTAHKLLTEMTKRHGLRPNTTHYATLINSYGCLHRDVSSALAVYKEMQKAGVAADETVYQALLNTHIENNDMKSAEDLYQTMLKKGAKSSSYIENLFITGYGRQGRLDKAQETFDKMSDYDQLSREPSTYEALVKAYIENGQKENALKVIEQMQAREFPPKVVDSVVQIIQTEKH
ncbi:Pentatricopeptide repeat-containing protein 5, mitochondrial [Choanephora cucurbitarum]|uniref:Pentatricopeptide repeat-containing protein 5, mitochondrial n=1 Tax=Choanephora cucurbitarum TaxID=101091 RepID=A0A1C7NPZ7_9FUNG|nr:Pentatricopeptide repeat-containing protein 5, mitochondrial [Choanephora cucurbitarum]